MWVPVSNHFRRALVHQLKVGIAVDVLDQSSAGGDAVPVVAKRRAENFSVPHLIADNVRIYVVKPEAAYRLPLFAHLDLDAAFGVVAAAS